MVDEGTEEKRNNMNDLCSVYGLDCQQGIKAGEGMGKGEEREGEKEEGSSKGKGDNEKEAKIATSVFSAEDA